MIIDEQIRRFWREMKKNNNSVINSALKSNISENTARKYMNSGKLPSQVRPDHNWITRNNPFEIIWNETKEFLENNHGLEAKSLFEHFQKKYPGKFQDGQLRTFQRKIKIWKAIEGSPKEVFFDQKHYPGDLCQSDFTHMDELGITINREQFPHLLYHFVLTYSNWETASICFSESFESLASGFQSALVELGGVPEKHRIDRMSAAVNKPGNFEVFTQRYEALIKHYNIEGQRIQTGKPNENGDIEQRHNRLKNAMKQSLILRCSRDFSSRVEYEIFLRKILKEVNDGRMEKLSEEIPLLKSLPNKLFPECKRQKIKVKKNSTIRVSHNLYSVDSRLIGETIEARVYAENIEIWYAQQKIDKLPRLRGDGNHRICYRHIIDWLKRKPGAFENYRYKNDLFPTIRFRIAYDQLKIQNPGRAVKEYLEILYLAAMNSETLVDKSLRSLLDSEINMTSDAVKNLISKNEEFYPATKISIDDVNLSAYDTFLSCDVMHND